MHNYSICIQNCFFDIFLTFFFHKPGHKYCDRNHTHTHTHTHTLTHTHTHTHIYIILSPLDVSPREVFHHGSLPTKYLYTWVSACSAVLEHSSNAVKEVFVEHLKANNDDDDESITSY